MLTFEGASGSLSLAPLAVLGVDAASSPPCRWPSREYERLSPNRDPTGPRAPRRPLSPQRARLRGDDRTDAQSGEPRELPLPDRPRRDTLHARPRAQVAWHAGVSRFLGRDRCNDFLLGVAFAGDTYAAPLSDRSRSPRPSNGSARAGPPSAGARSASPTTGRSRPGRKRDLNPAEWDRLSAAVAGAFRTRRAPEAVSVLKSPPTRSRKIQPTFT